MGWTHPYQLLLSKRVSPAQEKVSARLRPAEALAGDYLALQSGFGTHHQGRLRHHRRRHKTSGFRETQELCGAADGARAESP